MDPLLNVTGILSAVMLVFVLVSVRRAHIRPEYSVTWIVALGCMLVLSRSWKLLTLIRDAVGLPDTPLTLFLAGAGGAAFMLFRFSVIVSKLKDNNIALAQRVAILEYQLKTLGQNENR